jgi:hypothetical protein
MVFVLNGAPPLAGLPETPLTVVSYNSPLVSIVPLADRLTQNFEISKFSVHAQFNIVDVILFKGQPG